MPKISLLTRSSDPLYAYCMLRTASTNTVLYRSNVHVDRCARTKVPATPRDQCVHRHACMCTCPTRCRPRLFGLRPWPRARPSWERSSLSRHEGRGDHGRAVTNRRGPCGAGAFIADGRICLLQVCQAVRCSRNGWRSAIGPSDHRAEPFRGG